MWGKQIRGLCIAYGRICISREGEPERAHGTTDSCVLEYILPAVNGIPFIDTENKILRERINRVLISRLCICMRISLPAFFS